MKIYMAPLEGVTNYVYRSVYARYFSGVDKYFTPFIVPHMKKGFSNSERCELSERFNNGLKVVPQILTNSSDGFLKLADEIYQMGYEEINLNLGCPSKTVTSKGKGSGFLKDLEGLENFFEKVFDKKEKYRLSIKTRVGFESFEEWNELIEVFRKFDFSEIIVHPRTALMMYGGVASRDEYEYCIDKFNQKPVFNGDINTKNDFLELFKRFGNTDIMLGRGLVANPFLPEQILAKENTDCEPVRQSDKNKLKFFEFNNELINTYMELDYGERNTLFRLKEIWGFILAKSDDKNALRDIRKSNTVRDINKTIRKYLKII